MGFHRAVLEMTGVDIVDQPNYPFAFVRADALEYVKEHAHEYAFIAASPPCKAGTPEPCSSRERAGKAGSSTI